MVKFKRWIKQNVDENVRKEGNKYSTMETRSVFMLQAKWKRPLTKSLLATLD